MAVASTDVVETPWSVRTAETVMARHPLLARRWHYEPGVVLLAIRQVWLATGDRRYFDYIKANVDSLVTPEGEIRTYRLDDYNLDQINEGKVLFALYHETGDERYRKAARLLRDQLTTQPRTAGGAWWHKQIYPHQVWLDGVYMASPFYAEYGTAFGEPAAYDDVVRHIVLAEQVMRDPHTGLLYHGWDESKSQAWADPQTGCSPCFWGRAVGWYAMALADVLDHLPLDHAGREQVMSIFRVLATRIMAVQDPITGTWYQVLDQGDRHGNYLEASASCMFVYALAKGVRLGYLDRTALDVAWRGYAGILDRFITIDGAGLVSVHGTCAVAGLGGKPYRDGSFEYYVGERVVSNEFKGVGAFILASTEIEQLACAGDLRAVVPVGTLERLYAHHEPG
ncbi:MAG: glycoside hydrolase family 88 protein [Anaerolineae bacterium]|nr:glycoside hydrolase family 88 protein [Anaerolineae bacterium]